SRPMSTPKPKTAPTQTSGRSRTCSRQSSLWRTVSSSALTSRDRLARMRSISASISLVVRLTSPMLHLIRHGRAAAAQPVRDEPDQPAAERDVDDGADEEPQPERRQHRLGGDDAAGAQHPQPDEADEPGEHEDRRGAHAARELDARQLEVVL